MAKPLKRGLSIIAIATAGAVAGYVAPPFEVFKAATKEQFPKAHTELARLYEKQLEEKANRLSIVQELRNNSDFKESRAWDGLSKDDRTNTVTAGRYRQPDGLGIDPLVFTNEKDKSTVVLAHVGQRLVGFPKIVHGGLLFTLLDESLGRTAFMSFDKGVGVTASMTMNYKSPTLADQFIVIRTKTDRCEGGRKAYVSGQVETTSGKLLVEANGLFVQPKKFSLKRLPGF